MSLLDFIYEDVQCKLKDLEQINQDLLMNMSFDDDDCKSAKNEIWKNKSNMQVGFKIMDLIKKNNHNGLAYYLPKFYNDLI